MNGEVPDELRVILITNTLSISGGSESLVLNIFHALKKRSGVKVKLVTLKDQNNPGGFEIPELKSTLFSDPDFIDCDCHVTLSVIKPHNVDITEFANLVNNFKPHIIHSHLFISELIAHQVIFPGVKYFTHCHDNMSQLRNMSLKTFTKKSLFTDFYEKQHLVRQYLKCDNRFIAVSSDTKNYFEHVLPEALKNNVALLPNAIITKNFQYPARQPDTGVIRIINVGSFIPVKNQQLLIPVTKALLKRGRKVEVTLLGSGPEYEKVKAEVAANGLQQVISMPGTKTNVADYYAAANIYVHTCTHEAFGLVFLEAMASGLPVVCLDAKGNRGLIDEGKTGFMITEQNPELFADAIEKVFESNSQYQAMSARSVEAAAKYDIEEYTTRLLKLYKAPETVVDVVKENAPEELRVLLITNTMSISGGAEALVLNIFNALKQRPGIKVKLVTLKKAARKTGFDILGIEGPLAADPDFFDCNCYVNLSVLKSNHVDVTEFADIVHSFKPHVIHSHLFLSELVAHELIFPGVKYYSHCHDNVPQLRNFSFKTLTKKNLFTDFFEKQHLMRSYIKCNNRFISISADTKSYFQDVLPGKLKNNIYSLDNAIVTQNFESAIGPRNLDTIRIINVGRFTVTKNQQFLVDVTKALIKRGRQVEVTLLGKGEEYEKVKAKVAANNLNSVISMPGTKADMAGYYATANIYVHVCRHEPFGLVLLEAMASGLPVVSLDGRGNRDLIKEGENGYMLNAEDPEAFADAIEKTLKDKAAYQTMSANAIAFARQYDIEEYISKLIGLYRSR